MATVHNIVGLMISLGKEDINDEDMKKYFKENGFDSPYTSFGLDTVTLDGTFDHHDLMLMVEYLCLKKSQNQKSVNLEKTLKSLR